MPAFNAWFPTSQYGTAVLNVKDFGALGNGVANDGPAIQLAFNAIKSSTTARGLYFPAGIYNTTQVLYITNTEGVHIFGDGMLSTIISYSGSATAGQVEGNATAQAITPVIMINGLKFSMIENLWISPVADGGSGGTVGIYIFQDGTKGITHSNTWINVMVQGAAPLNGCTTCWLVGYQANALCSEQTYIGCQANYASGYGWRLQQANALNNNLINCAGVFNGVWASAPVGSMNILGASLAANTIDIQPGQTPILIMGCRTEGLQFVDMSTQSFASIISCTQIPGAVGSSYFVNIENGSTATLDNCYYAIGSSTNGPRITGTNGTIWVRGGYSENGYTLIGDYTGSIIEFRMLMITPPTTVAGLPTAATKWSGNRQFVNDSSAAAPTFGSTIAGGGTKTVPLWCDGTTWRVG